VLNVVRQTSDTFLDSDSGKQRHFLVLPREESLSSMSAKLLQSQNSTTNNCIHLLISSKRQSDLLSVDNRKRNAVLALSATLLRLSSGKNAFNGGYWKTTEISEESILISIEVNPKHSLTHHDAFGILQFALSKDPLPQSNIKAPTLEEFVVELKVLRGDVYVNRVQRDLSGILDNLCTSAKRQRQEITGLVSVLSFSKSTDLVCEYLTQYLGKCSGELQAQSRSRDAGYISRKIDGALHVLFELTEKSAIRSLTSTASPILNQLIKGCLQAPLFSRAIRQSFLKAIDFFTAEPALVDVIRQTDTDDARGFIIIQRFLSPESDLVDLSEGTALINRLLKMSSKGLVLLARDMRRTVPDTSRGPSASLADCIAWISQPDGSGHLRQTSLSKCLLLHYFNCLRPGLILWLNENHQRIGLVKDDVVELLALAGYDVPYVVAINKYFLSSHLSFGIAPPSKCSNIVEYFQLNLKKWRGRVQSEECFTERIEQPLVSVIFTTYKPDIELFKLSLESILFQSYRNIELIVIDDCSPLDTSRQLVSLIGTIAQHHAHPVIYQRNSSNVGQYVSRNTAIAMAKGEFIAIQDDDDISHPERLYTQVAPMLKYPAIIATHANHIRISNNARIMSDGDGLGEIQGDAPVSFIWRRQVFREIGSFLPTKTRGDIEFRSRMRQHYGSAAIQALNQPLVLMRGGMGTVSSDKEYYYRSALSALRYMMTHIPAGADNSQDAQRWIPTLLQ
jgi:hypothetical protein